MLHVNGASSGCTSTGRVLAMLFGCRTWRRHDRSRAAPAARIEPRTAASHGRLRLRFERNHGQVDGRVQRWLREGDMMKILRYALWVVLALVVLVAFAVVGLRLWAPHRQKAADRAWAESFESMEALLARYPSTPDSPAALELAALAQALGISMLPPAWPRPDGKTPAPGAEAWREETKRFQPLVSFVAGQGAKTDDETLDAPPKEVAEFLSRRAGEIEAVEARILGPDPIAWAIDIRKGFDAPIPSLAGYRHLESVLLAHALEAARVGADGLAAQRALEASWKLNLTLRERPELISQLTAMALAALHNDVLRRVPEVPVEWAGRLSSHDWRRGLLRSYQADALQFMITARKGWPPLSDGRASPPADLVWKAASGVFLDLSLANYSEKMRRMAAEVRQQDPCSIDVEAFSRRTEEAIPRWNIVARIAMPSFARSWVSAGRAALGDELTRLVVQVKAQARTPEASAPLPATVPSSACAGLTWAVKTLPNGDIQIEADRNPFPDPKLAALLAFRVHRAPARRTGAAAGGRRSGAGQDPEITHVQDRHVAEPGVAPAKSRTAWSVARTRSAAGDRVGFPLRRGALGPIRVRTGCLARGSPAGFGEWGHDLPRVDSCALNGGAAAWPAIRPGSVFQPRLATRPVLREEAQTHYGSPPPWVRGTTTLRSPRKCRRDQPPPPSGALRLSALRT